MGFTVEIQRVIVDQCAGGDEMLVKARLAIHAEGCCSPNKYEGVRLLPLRPYGKRPLNVPLERGMAGFSTCFQ